MAVLGWWLTAAVLLHNFEEAVWLPGWPAGAKWYAGVGRRRLRVAAGIFSGVVVGLTAVGSGARASSCAVYVMAGYALAMMLNAVAPHMLATLAMRSYMPGTATAVFLVLPLGAAYLHRALAEHWIAGRTFLWAGPLTAAGFAGLVALLLLAGRAPATRWLPGGKPRQSDREEEVSRGRE